MTAVDRKLNKKTCRAYNYKMYILFQITVTQNLKKTR